MGGVLKKAREDRERQGGVWVVCPTSGDMGTRAGGSQGKGGLWRVGGMMRKQCWLSGPLAQGPRLLRTGSDRSGKQGCGCREGQGEKQYLAASSGEELDNEPRSTGGLAGRGEGGLPGLLAPSLPPTRPAVGRGRQPGEGQCPQWMWEVGRSGWGLGRGDALNRRKPGGN